MDALTVSFRDQLAALAEEAQKAWVWPSAEAGFALHVFAKAGQAPPFPVEALTLSEGNRRRLDQAPILAAAGYAFCLGDGLEDAPLIAAWAEGLTRLAGRNPFPVDRASFAYRPIELLGICLGAVHCPATPASCREWLRSMLSGGQVKMSSGGLWATLLGACAADALSADWKAPVLSLPAEVGDSELALLHWMQIAYPNAHLELSAASGDAWERELARRCTTAFLCGGDAAQASLLHSAVRGVSNRVVQAAYAATPAPSPDAEGKAALPAVPEERHPLPGYNLEAQCWYTPLPGEEEREEEDLGEHRIEVVLLTAVPVELRAVLRRLQPLPGERAIWRIVKLKETYYLGQFGQHNAVVTMCRMGYSDQGASFSATFKAIDAWRPKAAIMVGIAYGKDPENQKIGDVLVSSQVVCCGVQRRGLDPRDGNPEVIFRGANPPCGAALLNRFRNAIHWEFLRPDGVTCAVKEGPILSAEVLVDDPAYKAELFRAFPQAIGGEMEGVGVYAAGAEWGTEWIVVKAICDWADGRKGTTHQPLAAAAAVSLVYDVLSWRNALADVKRPV